MDRKELSVSVILLLSAIESSIESMLPFVMTKRADRHLLSPNASFTMGSHTFSMVSNDSGLVASYNIMAVSAMLSREARNRRFS